MRLFILKKYIEKKGDYIIAIACNMRQWLGISKESLLV
jgi:hypothetical protein